VHQTKFIVVTGGVLSGLGKGTATAAIGRLIKGSKKIVTVKCDGYLNVDPGTMNPVEHGEVFVLHDGGEVDMDFGHYERFLDINCKFSWNLTSGKIFNSVIQRERKGDFLGKTIQIFPHVVNEVKLWWKRIIDEEKPDVMMIEIGGTVGDIENSWYIWAAQQLRKIVGPDNVFYIHLTYVPFLDNVGEPKTKPAQRDIAQLREKGITPDAIICRSKMLLSKKIKDKLAMLCDLEPEQVISGRDIGNIYEIPLMFKQEGLLKLIDDKLKLGEQELGIWETLVNNLRTPQREITIAICGKYTELRDSYASVIEALTHAGAHVAAKVHTRWIETTDIEEGKLTPAAALAGADGVLVPGGFGGRGAEGKISVIQFARENKIPYLGICYGLQLAVIEFARNVCRLPDANTTEINPGTPHPVIDILPEQREVYLKGGTMRLGASKNDIKPGTLAGALYANTQECWERHRHRYEVNPDYHARLAAAGMILSATSQNGRIAEFIEIPNHPFFFATQAHNELTSRLEKPNPAFSGFVRACCKLPPVPIPEEIHK